MRIALVNDMMAAVEAMRRVLLSTPNHQIAWIARDGAEALDLCASDTPDLILMDLMMPAMDGIEATRRIMARKPCAIVVVTADVTGHSSKVFEAMGAGALDAVNTPVLGSGGSCEGAEALLAKIDTIRRLIGEAPAIQRSASAPQVTRRPLPHRNALVALGASAGGPAALAKVLALLPADFAAPVVIVQHVDAHFAQGLAQWLDHRTPIRVRLAREGDRPQAGFALLAGQNAHLVFASATRLVYTRLSADCYCHPSIDLFLKSADQFWPGEIVGVLLTGMGRDGAEGLRTLRAKGHHTIAQDRQTSAVYGMPGAAAEMGAASEILALDKIGPRLTNMVAQIMKVHG